MISPSVLRAAFTQALKDDFELLALLGNSQDNIEEYTQETRGDLASTIADLEPPKLLVCYAGTGLTGRQTTLWFPRFELVIRPKDSDPLDIFALIVNNHLKETIHSKYHQMEPPMMDRRFIAISDTSQLDSWSITTGFSEKGT